MTQFCISRVAVSAWCLIEHVFCLQAIAGLIAAQKADKEAQRQRCVSALCQSRQAQACPGQQLCRHNLLHNRLHMLMHIGILETCLAGLVGNALCQVYADLIDVAVWL